jgi:hypothetical protein
MMSVVSLQTCWAIKKHWNNKFYYVVASCWLLLSDLYYNAQFHEHPGFFFLALRIAARSYIGSYCTNVLLLNAFMLATQEWNISWRSLACPSVRLSSPEFDWIWDMHWKLQDKFHFGFYLSIYKVWLLSNETAHAADGSLPLMTKVRDRPHYFEFKTHLLHILKNWKFGYVLNSSYYFSPFESFVNIIFLRRTKWPHWNSSKLYGKWNVFACKIFFFLKIPF